MKFLVIFLILIVLAGVVLADMRRRRRGQTAIDVKTTRLSSFFGSGSHAVNVRSADNVRLLSDKQIDGVERGIDDK